MYFISSFVLLHVLSAVVIWGWGWCLGQRLLCRAGSVPPGRSIGHPVEDRDPGTLGCSEGDGRLLEAALQRAPEPKPRWKRVKRLHRTRAMQWGGALPMEEAANLEKNQQTAVRFLPVASWEWSRMLRAGGQVVLAWSVGFRHVLTAPVALKLLF